MNEIKTLSQSARWGYTGIWVAKHHRIGSSWSLTLISGDGYPGLTLEDKTYTWKYNAFLRLYDENGGTKENLLLSLPRDTWWKLYGLIRAYDHLGPGMRTPPHDSGLFEASRSIDQLRDDLHMRINDVIESIMKQR